MLFAYLDEATLREVQRAAIELGFATDGQLAALAAGISPAFVASHSRGDNAQARLLTLTTRMNQTRALVSGEVPLAKWLSNAIFLAGELPEQEIVLRKALEKASADGDPAAGGASGTEPDVARMPVADGGLEVQIDEDDTLGVAFLHEGAKAAQSVAKLLVHLHYDGQPAMQHGKPQVIGGTGWVLAPGLLVTNFHVVNARVPLEPAAGSVDFARQGAATQVLFDFYEAGSRIQATRSTDCVASDRDLDFALLRLSPDGSARQPLRLRRGYLIKLTGQVLRDRVNVLQHPNGDPMRLGFRNNFVVTGTESRLSYLTDTAGGSSGSPIFDDHWQVTALHKGFATLDKPLTVRSPAWSRIIKQENYGIPIGRILDHLSAHHPDLMAEVTVGQAALRND